LLPIDWGAFYEQVSERGMVENWFQSYYSMTTMSIREAMLQIDKLPTGNFNNTKNIECIWKTHRQRLKDWNEEYELDLARHVIVSVMKHRSAEPYIKPLDKGFIESTC
jgi:hypothetical protein